MTTPTPAQADEKARDVLLFASYCGTDNPDCSDAKPCPTCLGMSNVFRCAGPMTYVRQLAPEWNTQAPPVCEELHPEGEAVAWVQPGYLDMLQKYGNCSMRVEPIEQLDYIVPLFASPPAPAGVKVDPERIAKSLASMLIEYVDGGINSNQNWRTGFDEIILARLRRLLPPSTEAQAASASTPAEALPDGVDVEALIERIMDIRGRLVELRHDMAAEALGMAVACLSSAPAQAGSRKDLSAHPRGSGQSANEVETLRHDLAEARENERKAVDELCRWRSAFQRVTPGGSEFFNPQAVREWADKLKMDVFEANKRAALAERKALENSKPALADATPNGSAPAGEER